MYRYINIYNIERDISEKEIKNSTDCNIEELLYINITNRIGID